MKTMFKINSWSERIDVFQVSKVSDKSVWYLSQDGYERRDLLCTQEYRWYDTRPEAIKYLLGILNANVSAAASQLHRANSALEVFKVAEGMSVEYQVKKEP